VKKKKSVSRREKRGTVVSIRLLPTELQTDK